MAQLKVAELAWGRMTAPDLDVMEKFLLDFGMVRAARTADALYMRGTDPEHHIHVTHQGAPRFVGFAYSVDDPEALTRAAKLPGVRGLYMATHVNGKNLDDESLFPVYAACERLGLPIFLHPMMINNERMKQFYLVNLCGNPFDTALAASHLIYGGVLDKCPKLEVNLPHAGGAVPMLIGRMDHGYAVRRDVPALPRPLIAADGPAIGFVLVGHWLPPVIWAWAITGMSVARRSSRSRNGVMEVLCSVVRM